MRKFILCLLAILLVSGVAFAVSIPQTESPTSGPAVWLVPVYNNASADLDVGDVVVWDIGNSTGDNDNYVTRTTTADTYLVAGVVYPSAITNGDTGTIAVKGVVQVDYATGAGPGAAGSLLCSSTTTGSASNCATNAAAFGIVTTANSSNSVNAYIFGK